MFSVVSVWSLEDPYVTTTWTDLFKLVHLVSIKACIVSQQMVRILLECFLVLSCIPGIHTSFWRLNQIKGMSFGHENTLIPAYHEPKTKNQVTKCYPQ